MLRIAVPNKGALSESAREILTEAGLTVDGVAGSISARLAEHAPTT